MNFPSVIVGLVAAQCVQIGALFVLTWCAGRWLPRDRPFLAHGLWVLLLIKCITPPVWASDVGLFSWVYCQPSAGAPAQDVAEPTGTIVNDPQLVREMKEQTPALPAAVPVNRTVSIPEAIGLESGGGGGGEQAIPWTVIVLSIWGFGAVILSTTALGRFFLYRRRIFRAAIVHDDVWDAELNALRKRLGVRRNVRLVAKCQSKGVT